VSPSQRLLITVATVLLTSFIAGVLWHWILNTDIPTFVIGIVGGITAAAAWELLKRIGVEE